MEKHQIIQSYEISVNETHQIQKQKATRQAEPTLTSKDKDRYSKVHQVASF